MVLFSWSTNCCSSTGHSRQDTAVFISGHPSVVLNVIRPSGRVKLTALKLWRCGFCYYRAGGRLSRAEISSSLSSPLQPICCSTTPLPPCMVASLLSVQGMQISVWCNAAFLVHHDTAQLPHSHYLITWSVFNGMELLRGVICWHKMSSSVKCILKL